MKKTAIFHYVFSALEGFLSGACFYQASRSGEKRHKVLLYAASALWFASSVLDALAGGRMLRESPELETNDGGNDND